MTNTDQMQALADQARQAMAQKDEGFPDTWKGDPNPIITEALPALVKPQNADSPLFEFRQPDGSRFTLWVSNNLFQALRRAGAQVGEPCVILRSDSKVPVTLSDGTEREIWQWVVTTPHGSSARGGQAMTLDAYEQRQQRLEAGDPSGDVPRGDEVEVEAELVAEPSSIEAAIAADDEDFPFHHLPDMGRRGERWHHA